MKNRLLASLWVSLAVVQTGCGGGGGSSGGAAPVPPPTPPSLDASALRLAELSGTCSLPAGCLSVQKLFIDANGEITGFWSERGSGSTALKAGNLMHTGAALMSSVVVDASLNNIDSAILATSARQYMYLYQPSTTPPGAAPPPAPLGGYVTQSRLVTLGASGGASVSASVVTPSTVQPTTPLVHDHAGNLTAIVSGTTAPYPTASLAGGTQVQLLTPAALPFNTVESRSFAEADSIAPRALWAVLGKEASTDVRGVWINHLSLADGSLVPIGRVSQEEVRSVGVTSRHCVSDPQVKSVATGEFVVSWTQQNAALNGCDLMINGQRVNASTWDVVDHAVAGGMNNALAAVWREVDPSTFVARLRWNQRLAGNAQWVGAASVDPLYDTAANVTALASAAGPNGTLAVVWEPCEGTATLCSTRVRLVSKFSNGVWTTRSMNRSVAVQSIAINASGQAVVLAVGNSCSGVNDCTELSAYRF